MDIGRRGIELAALGGFDKCTWDGAADSYPSHCKYLLLVYSPCSCKSLAGIILQLGFQNALELVHLAHSVGLTTYMSAGFKFHNIQDAVLSGVDGIGNCFNTLYNRHVYSFRTLRYRRCSDLAIHGRRLRDARPLRKCNAPIFSNISADVLLFQLDRRTHRQDHRRA